jgi:hypothetical protein
MDTVIDYYDKNRSASRAEIERDSIYKIHID